MDSDRICFLCIRLWLLGVKKLASRIIGSKSSALKLLVFKFLSNGFQFCIRQNEKNVMQHFILMWFQFASELLKCVQLPLTTTYPCLAKHPLALTWEANTDSFKLWVLNPESIIWSYAYSVIRQNLSCSQNFEAKALPNGGLIKNLWSGSRCSFM